MHLGREWKTSPACERDRLLSLAADMHRDGIVAFCLAPEMMAWAGSKCIMALVDLADSLSLDNRVDPPLGVGVNRCD